MPGRARGSQPSDEVHQAVAGTAMLHLADPEDNLWEITSLFIGSESAV